MHPKYTLHTKCSVLEYFLAFSSRFPILVKAGKVDNTDSTIGNRKNRGNRKGRRIDKRKCLTQSGPDPWKQCVFPFKWDGKTFHGCTTHTSDHRLWCSTKVDSYGNHIVGKNYWGHCTSNCPTQSSNTQHQTYHNNNQNHHQNQHQHTQSINITFTRNFSRFLI